MQSSSRAPVLSATLRRVSCWIIRRLPRLLHDLREAPVLHLRERARLDDAHGVAHAGRVLLVVRVELDRAADDLLVARVRLDHVDLDDDRLVAVVGHDDAAALLPAAALVVRLLGPRDRLARRRLLALRLRALPALRARDVPVRALLLLATRFSWGTSRFPRSPLHWSAVADGRLRRRLGSFLDRSLLFVCHRYVAFLSC